jgi:Tol biopolymer transport system component
VGIWRIEPSPDGKSLFYSSGGKLICRDLESQQDKEIPLMPQRGWVAWNLSPDGKHFVFAVNVHQPEKGWGRGIATVPVTGDKPSQLLEWENVAGTLFDVTWMPDGKHILFTFQPEDSFSTTEFWQIRADGGEPKKVLTTHFGWCYSLRVHPDGQRVAFQAAQRFHEMWVMENFLPTGEVASR